MSERDDRIKAVSASLAESACLVFGRDPRAEQGHIAQVAQRIEEAMFRESLEAMSKHGVFNCKQCGSQVTVLEVRCSACKEKDT